VGAAPAEQMTAAAPAAVITHSLGYLEKRLAQIQYATFAAHGYPLGSGSVESANKLVVEARLKRGRHALGTGARESAGGAAHRGMQ
jgi:hypothetical protein